MPGHPTLAHGSDVTVDAITGQSVGENYLFYLDILRALDDQGAAVNVALLEAHTADTTEQRRAALTRLHTRLRDMAATANDALGAWPEPADGPA
ncbi:hypothetical protein [Paractinoplanes hotanensis]|uniref:Uncharacterized protein n=1 Tax=Paractinoplanes hotanensis TaxID=2906497 RepID=A0ABT0YCW7_9ACTN|nr:hypothetical protein [Actinoplanes hotanensis]MCM4083902.1 hypothetical protein [Actinoplanes hotanensis]